MTSSQIVPEVNRRARPLKRVLRWLGLLLLGIALLGMTGWATLAITFADLSGASPRYVLATIIAVGLVATIAFIHPRRYGLLAFVLIFCVVLLWYLRLKPSNTRDWLPDVSELAWAQIDGNHVVVHNVRNFIYRSETDYAPRWEDRSYDLDKLRSFDLILVYWGSKAIAHGIVSFGFDDGQYLACSIETRKERSESYSTIQGFFRQYELIYIFADERDVLRLRTNYRNEDVYLYRTRVSPPQARAIFLSYLQQANALRDRPQWYNALTSNCATGIVPHARAGHPAAHLSWEVLLSGYGARQAYRGGNLDDSIPFEQLESRSHINAAAIAAGDDAGFSQRIRMSLPVPSPLAEGNTQAASAAVTSSN